MVKVVCDVSRHDASKQLAVENLRGKNDGGVPISPTAGSSSARTWDRARAPTQWPRPSHPDAPFQSELRPHRRLVGLPKSRQSGPCGRRPPFSPAMLDRLARRGARRKCRRCRPLPRRCSLLRGRHAHRTAVLCRRGELLRAMVSPGLTVRLSGIESKAAPRPSPQPGVPACGARRERERASHSGRSCFQGLRSSELAIG